MVTLAFALAYLSGQVPTTPPKPVPPQPKLISTEITVGKGDDVEFGDLVSVDYTGKLANGKVFDTSKKPHGGPISLVVGIGEVIKGWDQGLIGMKNGGIRKLVIPPELAYGASGAPGAPGEQPVIPPNATITFTIAVHKVDHAAKRMKVEITKAGAGPEAKLYDDLVLRMTCKSSDGILIIDTDKNPDGVPFRPGAPTPDRPIPGFTLAVLGMKAGEKRTVTVPPELAFGATGIPTLKVKPNDTITIDIELVSIGGTQTTSGGRETRQ